MKSTKIVFAAAALTGLIAGTTVRASIGSYGQQRRDAQVKAGQKVVSMDDKDTGKHSCKGQNSCKGQGGCKSGDNGCKSKNSCKGHGGCHTNGEDGKA
jgi:hypothetical protein